MSHYSSMSISTFLVAYRGFPWPILHCVLGIFGYFQKRFPSGTFSKLRTWKPIATARRPSQGLSTLSIHILRFSGYLWLSTVYLQQLSPLYHLMSVSLCVQRYGREACRCRLTALAYVNYATCLDRPTISSLAR